MSVAQNRRPAPRRMPAPKCEPVPEGRPLACGWPNKKFPGRTYMCPCGFVSPDRLRDNYWHKGNKTR